MVMKINFLGTMSTKYDIEIQYSFIKSYARQIDNNVKDKCCLFIFDNIYFCPMFVNMSFIILTRFVVNLKIQNQSEWEGFNPNIFF